MFKHYFGNVYQCFAKTIWVKEHGFSCFRIGCKSNGK